jgi:phthiocerol/phenolphthiocerol synthesis type-I polyketide synthase C
MRDAIAIVGMACRIPGAATLDGFWQLMMDGANPIREIGSGRWQGKLDDVELFDTDFFGIAPRDARGIDPQQRILLEVAHEAFEDAGIPPSTFAGSGTGVFVGQHTSDYALLQTERRADAEVRVLMGAAVRAMTSGRLSFAFDLRGPSLTVDAACSSSLAAVHTAVRAIRSGECPAALVGGVNIVLLPAMTSAFAAAGMAASDGRCKFGDERADGFVRSDGVAAVLLKPLVDAVRDGDRVRAVILGSAVTNDGRSSGYLVTPAVEGQEQMLRAAYADAGVDPADVAYVEAHGTGTAIGDQVELDALSHVVGAGRAPDQPCLVGSAKTTVGHTESTAGLVGLIRTVLCLERSTVPGYAALGVLSASANRAGIVLPRQPAKIGAGRPALAGVSSFGLSGTNVHIVLTGAPETAGDDAAGPAPDRAAALLLSARSPQALDDLARAYRARVAAPGARWAELARGAADRRDHYEYRLAVMADGAADAVPLLDDAAAGSTGPRVARSGGPVQRRPRTAFVFSGQGGQWVGMGRELLADEPAFAHAVLRCDEAVRAEAGFSVLERLTAAGGRFDDIAVVQPVLWTMQVALAQLFRSWGIQPDVVIGHSMGEVAAAHVAGALTLADAAAVICRRSSLTRRVSGRGGMLLVELSEEEATAAIAGTDIAVAACNGPSQTVLAGAHDALDGLVVRLREADVFARRIDADIASHSPQMDPLGGELAGLLHTISPRPGEVPIRSTVLDDVVDGAGMDAAYWVANLRQPVRFLSAVRAELAQGDTVFLEMSPHPVLSQAVTQTIEDAGAQGCAVPVLRRGEPDRRSVVAALGRLYVAGVPVRGEAAAGPGRGAALDLPRYPWQHTPHWLDDASGPTDEPTPAPEEPSSSRLAAGRDRRAERLGVARHRYVLDHRVDGTPIVPGTAYVDYVTTAAAEHLGGPVLVRDMRFERAIFIEADDAREWTTDLEPRADGELRCTVRSRSADGSGWTRHITAVATRRNGPEPVGDLSCALDGARSRCTRRQDPDAFYREHARRGNGWGPAFQGLTELWVGEGEAVGRLACPEPVAAELCDWLFHPAWLDACLHPLAAAAGDADDAFVLGEIAEVLLLRRPPDRLWSHARLRDDAAPGTCCGDVDIVDEAGVPVAQVRGLTLRYLGGGRRVNGRPTPPRGPEERRPVDQGLHQLSWVESSPPTPDSAGPGRWVVLTDGGEAGNGVVDGLRAAGQGVVQVRAGSGYRRAWSTDFEVHPGSADDLQRVFFDVAREGPIRGVVHLWTLGIGVALPGSTWTTPARDLAATSIACLVTAMDTPLLGSPRLWLVTCGAQAVDEGDRLLAPFQAPVWGLGRALAEEEKQLAPVLVDIDTGKEGTAALLAELLGTPSVIEDQIVLRGGRRLVARLRRWSGPIASADHAPTRWTGGPARLEQARAGDIDSLTECPAELPEPGPGEVRIAVSHVGLNFQDVLLATGTFPAEPGEEPWLGKDCSGLVEKVGSGVHGLRPGDEVIALATATMATHVVTDARLVAHKPARLSLAEAATLPAPFVTALHGLVELARVERGDSVVIHTGTGGVGLAGLQIALWRGARVFATAGTPEKRLALLAAGASHVADSRSVAFADEFKAAAGERGIDVVLNTLTGPAIPAGLGLLGPTGRYVELTKRDFQAGSEIPLGLLRGNRMFAAVDVVHMIRHDPDRAGALLRRVVSLVDSGALRPLPAEEFAAADAPSAFRQMARAKHIGRVLLRFTPPEATTSAEARVVRRDATYLVTGGLGGLGLEVSRWLVAEGARELLLTGRTPLPDRADWDALPTGSPQAEAVSAIRALEACGARVEYAAVDVADYDAMAALLAERAGAGRAPVRGALHLAGVLGRQQVRDLTAPDLDAVLRAKIEGAWTLHRLLGASVEFLVLFSSASAVLGSPLLGSYAAGNAFLDALARHRRDLGMAATSVNWGFWDADGMARRAGGDRPVAPRGVATFAPDEGLAILRDLLVTGTGSAVVMPVDWAAWAAEHPGAAASPLLRELVPAVSEPSPNPNPNPRPAPVPVPPAPAVIAVVPPPTEVDPVPTPERPPVRVPATGALVPPTGSPPHVSTAQQPGGRTGEPAEYVQYEARSAGAPSGNLDPPIHAPDSRWRALAVTQDVEHTVRRLAAAVVGMSVEELRSDRPLARIGLDSLMAAELRATIHHATGVRLPLRLLLDQTATITDLAAAVRDATLPPDPAAVAAVDRVQRESSSRSAHVVGWTRSRGAPTPTPPGHRTVATGFTASNPPAVSR